MQRLIPGKSKIKIELFDGVTIADIGVGTLFLVFMLLVLVSSLPFKLGICIFIIFLAVVLLVRIDTEPNYIYLFHIILHYAYPRKFNKSNKGDTKEKKGYEEINNIIAFTGISDEFIEYGSEYFGTVLEIDPIEFRFFTQSRRKKTIESGVGSILRNLNPDYSANIVKIDRPIRYEHYVDLEFGKIDALQKTFENGQIREDEFQARADIIYHRIEELQRINSEQKVIVPFYYIVLFGSDKRQLEIQTGNALHSLESGECKARRLGTKELAVFLKYSNQLDFNEAEIDDLEEKDYLEWAMPDKVEIKPGCVEISGITTHNYTIVNYPALVGDAWIAGLMAYPGTKVIIKAKPLNRSKSIRVIDRSLSDLRIKREGTKVDSKMLELNQHIETLTMLLETLQLENETLLQVNIYITAYDIALTREKALNKEEIESFLPNITQMKKMVRRAYQESGFRLSNHDFNQVKTFVGTQISGYDPLELQGRGIPSNSVAASFPWIYANIADQNGVKIGSVDGIPVLIDFFRRDSERVNSNMVIVGKSGSGKSYATKTLLTNLAADESKIFVLDPENEYTDLARNLHGKFINVGNAKYGRLNPFHIITSLDDEVEAVASGSFSTHLQFLEEFFRQILTDCDRDALEYLNNIIERMYTDFGITEETDLTHYRAEDYPTFDNVYDTILLEFQRTDNEYIRSMLRILMNYIAKFSTGGRNANIWNGKSTVTTDENFTVFNFQSLLANRNTIIANAQMLLVLKYIDNEVIKNRDYNIKYGMNRKVVVVIDEAHVFIDSKFPVALDFMFQLAKRIRKYNGMQIVVTQNIKDFVGSEELARKSTAIINACQYSMIFALAPDDVHDLVRLYEKSGGINSEEQEQITNASRGQVFGVMSPSNRTTYWVEALPEVEHIFSQPNYQSAYFSDEKGKAEWENMVSKSRELYFERRMKLLDETEKPTNEKISESRVTFMEVEAEEYREKSEKVSLQPFELKAGENGLDKRHEDSEEEFDDSYLKLRKQPTIVPKASILEETNEVLANLLERFSYDFMKNEIQKSVQKELVKAEAKVKKSNNSQTNKDVYSLKLGEEVELIDMEEFQSIAEDELELELDSEIIFKEEEKTTDELDSDYEVDVVSSTDVMSMILDELVKSDAPTSIEKMERYGEEIIEVTLEELARYISRKQRGDIIQ